LREDNLGFKKNLRKPEELSAQPFESQWSKNNEFEGDSWIRFFEEIPNQVGKIIQNP